MENGVHDGCLKIKCADYTARAQGSGLNPPILKILFTAEWSSRRLALWYGKPIISATAIIFIYFKNKLLFFSGSLKAYLVLIVIIISV
ncbi:MAG: hypothetical protein Q4E77_05330 [Conchiformibius sp.]|nr:hypothetical protein [Conchiformibius sp.]